MHDKWCFQRLLKVKYTVDVWPLYNISLHFLSLHVCWFLSQYELLCACFSPFR